LILDLRGYVWRFKRKDLKERFKRTGLLNSLALNFSSYIKFDRDKIGLHKLASEERLQLPW